MNTSSTALIILNTCPNREAAEKIAQLLIEKREAACVNLIDNIQSIYRWSGGIEKSHETLLIIKTTHLRYAAAEATIREEHPYTVPEIIAFEPKHGENDYLSWITQSTNKN
ncbi:MAG: divalent-cation tolerance protein CutA [Gammaproteobacteria bacterium]|nr:divalent-cation tolerance protein CutA [Gammaproteobacteria bacterium]MBT3489857.1 divalent-cation tolerance protein CutA [Gammaproteobacteria bacterium]MBT3719739.1 divalent-cation tolerance protein CutA [Gammaproteobacteria bacterium]MBT3845935.1 divalent-cation tolerance protein CutA [Gammaproteobacteria bacterium]MBT3893501.1 divalent-cation tolerance protein CutA [Gammaproteobacteria bacterium]